MLTLSMDCSLLNGLAMVLLKVTHQFYQNEGIDINTTAVTSDYNSGSATNSLITVTFESAPTGLAVGRCC